MKYFLGEKRRVELLNDLIKAEMETKYAQKFADLEDDMDEADLAMMALVQAISYFRNLVQDGQVIQGLLCLTHIMAEAIDRGLGEKDFPKSLAAIKDDLASKGVSVKIQ